MKIYSYSYSFLEWEDNVNKIDNRLNLVSGTGEITPLEYINTVYMFSLDVLYELSKAQRHKLKKHLDKEIK
jgi:hypothetical protein